MAIILNKLSGCMLAVATSLEGGRLRQLDNNAGGFVKTNQT